MHYFAIDVETANRFRSSICSIGLIEMCDGVAVNHWGFNVDPGQPFDEFNIKIHGITPEMVSGAYRLEAVLTWLCKILDGQIVVSHSSFDSSAIRLACESFGMNEPSCFWADSCEVARDVWPDLRNHKLKTICKKLKFDFQHHDAFEDAIGVAVIIESARAAGYQF